MICCKTICDHNVRIYHRKSRRVLRSAFRTVPAENHHNDVGGSCQLQELDSVVVLHLLPQMHPGPSDVEEPGVISLSAPQPHDEFLPLFCGSLTATPVSVNQSLSQLRP